MDYKKDMRQNLDSQSFTPDSLHSQERKIFYVSLSKKTEKVATAIYMVTNHIDDREAIKTSFRDTALSLVLDTLSLEDPMHPAEELFQSLHFVIQKLSTLLSMARTLGMITESNVRILQSELSAISAQCIGGQKLYSLTTLDDVLKTMYPDDVVKETLIDNGQKNNIASMSPIVVQAPAVQKAIQKSEVTQIKKERSMKNISTVSGSSVDRKHFIIQLIKDKGEVGIKDISMNFQDCSEKTIQRDINALVDEGMLSKTGDRRWSRYFIKK